MEGKHKLLLYMCALCTEADRKNTSSPVSDEKKKGGQEFLIFPTASSLSVCTLATLYFLLAYSFLWTYVSKKEDEELRKIEPSTSY